MKLLSHLEQPRIFQNAKFRAKLKTLKFWTKIALYGCFVKQFKNPILIFEVNTLKFVKNLKFDIKKNILWAFLSMILKKTINIFKISNLDFVKVNKIHVKTKKV